MALRTTERSGGRVPLGVAVRHDTWWLKPLLTALGLGSFAIYATFRAFENASYHTGSYLSPFYSPLLELHLVIAGWAVSPALYVLVFPLAFRGTCYYYRQAYYRAFFRDPQACAVPEPEGRRYHGEQVFPLIMQNFHRYALYAALVFLVFLWKDVVEAFESGGHFSMGLGSLIMLVNIVLLTGYTFGCHSLRHLVGGGRDCFACPMAGGAEEAKLSPSHKAWSLVSMLNKNHMQWAWCSLGSVVVTDLYIRCVATGLFPDPRFF